MFCRSLFVLLSFFIWPMCCLFFFDIRILITPLISSNSSYVMISIVISVCLPYKCNEPYCDFEVIYSFGLLNKETTMLRYCDYINKHNYYKIYWLVLSTMKLNYQLVFICNLSLRKCPLFISPWPTNNCPLCMVNKEYCTHVSSPKHRWMITYNLNSQRRKYIDLLWTNLSEEWMVV